MYLYYGIVRARVYIGIRVRVVRARVGIVIGVRVIVRANISIDIRVTASVCY